MTSSPPDATADPPPEVPPWARHLPPGIGPASVDLLAEGSLPAAWARRWAATPDADAIVGESGTASVTLRARDLDARTRVVAARFAAAGLRCGERVLMSAGTSVELVVAHVAALR